MKYTLSIVLLALSQTLWSQTHKSATLVLSDARFIYSLHVDTTSGICILWSVTIAHKDGHGKAQEIVIDTAKNNSRNEIVCDTVYLNKHEDDDFLIEDLDFDGYNDFRFVVTPRPAYGRNVSYFYWRYDPGKQLFEEYPALDTAALASPSFNQDTKQVHTYDDDMGVDPNRSHTYCTYEYIKGKLELVEIENVLLNTNSKGKQYTTTNRKKMVKGRWKIIENKVELVE